MSMVYDENGCPFVILKEKQVKSGIKSINVTELNILVAQPISTLTRSSLDPKGIDKILISLDGDVMITNDGATIMARMEVTHPIAKLLVVSLASQDGEIGDSMTNTVVMADALLE